MMTKSLGVAAALADAARTINAPHNLDETLEAVVKAACVSVSGFDHVGISVLHRDGTAETKAATGALVWELDALQYDLGEGPCMEAMQSEAVVIAERLRHDQRWPRYGPAAVKAGIRAQLGVRLCADDRTLGALNFFATSVDTIDPDAICVAQIFATHAALAFGRAQREDELTEGMHTRERIGVAVGLTMGRYQVDRHRAFQFLVRASSTSNTKLRVVAAEVVDEAEREYQEAANTAGPQSR